VLSFVNSGIVVVKLGYAVLIRMPVKRALVVCSRLYQVQS
jgi:hypothetical protein